MKLLFDIQCLQTQSALRGIGRYTRSLLTALLAEETEHKVTLLLTASLGDHGADLAREIAAEFPIADVVVCHLPGPTSALDPGNAVRASVAERIREAFILELNPDLVHVFSLFEGSRDNTVTSVGHLSANYPVTVTLYDLIPLANPAQYLDVDPQYAQWYLEKVGHLKKADGLLTISAFSAAEAAERLGCDADRVRIGPLGPIEALPSEAGARPLVDAIEDVGLAPGYVLYVGGADPRKNLPCLVTAWCQLAEDLRRDRALVFAGPISESDMLALREIAVGQHVAAESIVFLGRVADALLLDLYRECGVLVLPSWHEGFGLPALEAMAAGAPVIVANASSLPEVVGLQEALFDPFDPSSLTSLLQKVLIDDDFRDRLVAHSARRASEFSWERTADAARGFFEAMQAEAGSRVGGYSKGADSHAWRAGYADRLNDLIHCLAEPLRGEPDEDARVALMRQVARALEQNEQELARHYAKLDDRVTPWRIEGPFDSSYSLALVNRELARALSAAGIEVQLKSTEGPGDFDPDPAFLAANADIASLLVDDGVNFVPQAVTSRLLFPPRVNDLPTGLGLLHLWGWEEGEIPREWVDDFNTHLDGLTTMSGYVSKVLIDNGVCVPQVAVGVGVDHWERVQSDEHFALPAEASGFVFLHVSSCFPRKGVDKLLQAWGEAFTAEDDVTLLIKTFTNPHNNAAELLERARENHPSYPNAILIETDMDASELKALMQLCNALVAPSRGEGFGLPIAEAMLSGLPVIATGYGGHMDFCNADNAWLIDYQFAPARTHFGLHNSVWAEPCLKSLIQQLQAVHRAPQTEHKKRAVRGRKRLLSEYRWSHVAERVMDAGKRWQKCAPRRRQRLRVGWVGSWNTSCGIAAYSAYLLEHLDQDIKIYASHRNHDEELNSWLLPLDGSDVVRCWSPEMGSDLKALREALTADLPDAVVIQFNFGFYEFAELQGLIEWLKAAGVVVVMMFHSVEDPPGLPERRLALLGDAMHSCDRVLVHGYKALNTLKDLGVVANAAVILHGAIEWSGYDEVLQRPFFDAGGEGELLIASFGFLLPQKGLEQLVDAIALLRQRGVPARLKMLNAEYPAQVSKCAKDELITKIEALGLSEVVEIDTTFYSDEDCLYLLSQAHLIVFAYQDTGESSSAAVRHAVASGVPIAATPVPIFNDVQDAVITLPGVSPEEVASGIEGLLGWDASHWQAYKERAGNWRAAHVHRKVASRLSGQLEALVMSRLNAEP